MKMPEREENATPLTVLYQRHRSGDTEATERLFFYYAEKLSQLAQRRLSRKLAPRLDGDDVVQSALKSFLMRASAGQFRIENSQDMWKLLVTITLRKVHRQVRTHTADVRAVDRELPQPREGEVSIFDQLTEEPSDVEGVAYAEELEQLVRGDPPEFAQVLELRLADHSLREISVQLNLTKSTVESILNALKSRLQRRWNDLSGE